MLLTTDGTFNKKVQHLTLKSVSETRWESRIKAIRPLRFQLHEICESLDYLTKDDSRDMSTRHTAQSLLDKIKTFKFICSIVIWYNLLTKVNIVSKMLQNQNLNLNECHKGIKNLIGYFTDKRSDENFENFINEATVEAEKNNVEQEFPVVRQRKTKRQFSYESTDETVLDQKQQFKINFYFQILDTTIQSLQRRFEGIGRCNDLFSFLCNIHNLDSEVIKQSCMDLDIALQIQNGENICKDIDGIDLHNEIMSYKVLNPKSDTDTQSPINILNYITKNNLRSLFPNFFIALRIFLSLPISVASGERSFSKLRIIKNYLRTSMSQERLADLAIISIENQISETIDHNDMINEFASLKARRIAL